MASKSPCRRSAEAAASFAQPPMEYGAIHWAIWGGPQTKERIIADIERIHANGGGVYMINNSQRVQPKYLSPEYMDLVKTVVQECKKRGMKVWIETDCGYPDGFAGGLISRDYPQLGMQGILDRRALHRRCRPDAGYSAARRHAGHPGLSAHGGDGTRRGRGRADGQAVRPAGGRKFQIHRAPGRRG
jgi:hypothetical protein